MFMNRENQEFQLLCRNAIINPPGNQFVYAVDNQNKARSPMEMRKKIQNYSFMAHDKIGKGYSSVVYKGTNDLNGQTVAIKVIELKSLRDETSKHMLQTEIECFKEIHHKNLLRYENSYFTINNCYIITEYCPSGDLAKLIKQTGGLSVQEASHLFLQIYEGYLHFHHAGFIHRDIKPANIFLSHGEAKIADFGFCKRKTIGQRQNYNVGTPIYMPKESLTANIYNEKTDVWALGTTLYEMIYGHVPFKGRTQLQLRQQIQRGILIFSQYKPICEELKHFIASCLLNDSFKRISIKDMHKHPWIIKLKTSPNKTILKELIIDQPPMIKQEPPLLMKEERFDRYAQEKAEQSEKEALRISLPNDGFLSNKNKEYFDKHGKNNLNRRSISSMQKLKICNPKKKNSQLIPTERQPLANKSQIFLNTPLYTEPKRYQQVASKSIENNTQNKENMHQNNKRLFQVPPNPSSISLKVRPEQPKQTLDKKITYFRDNNKKGIEKIVSLINYFRLLYKLFQKMHQANQEIYDSEIKESINKLGNLVLIQFNRIFNLHLKCLATKANLFSFSADFWTEFSESQRWQMYDYVIKKYKAKYANLIKIEEKGNRLEEGRIVYNWYESLSSFYENLKALQDCKVILAKEKYILCEFTYLMLNLVDKSNVISKEGWQGFTQKYITAQQIVCDNIAVNINNYYQMVQKVKNMYKQFQRN